MKSRWLWVLISIIILMVVLITLYILSRLEIISAPSSSQLNVFMIIFVSLASLSVIVWGIYRITTRKLSENDKQIDPPKKIVPSGKAVKVWVRKFILETNIQYKIMVKDEIKPINPEAVVIRNETVHSDETGQTPDRFISFEAIVIEGNRPGLKVVSFRMDLGEDHISDNWNQWIRDNKSMNLLPNINFDKVPKTSAKEFQERMIMRQFEMEEEGVPREESKRIIEAFMQDDKPAKPTPQETIQNPSMTGQVQVVVPESQDDSETGESIADDISKYRKSKS